MANPFQFDESGTAQSTYCAACEELFADALDGVLSPADRSFFDQHLLDCAPCTNAFAQAQRGAAWLSLLKDPRPEPPADLIARILAQTAAQTAAFDRTTRLAPVIPFPARPAGRSRFAHFVRVMHEPRLAMTAAMAFFSIALTLNLAGVRLDRIHAANLTPTALKRSYYEANASAVRYCDNLKVVRVLESRVEDIRQATGDFRAPQSRPESKPAETQPESKPQQPEQSPASKPQPVPKGSSRRESPLPSSRILHAGFHAPAPKRFTHEGGLA